ncbi:hypothetical protein DL93DRAFT_732338 [Clavulina sp. PMI_390]|nr:hypothetical protein DL93DRAFT_732338 [Clavulina sp. PMI_390]
MVFLARFLRALCPSISVAATSSAWVPWLASRISAIVVSRMASISPALLSCFMLRPTLIAKFLGSSSPKYAPLPAIASRSPFFKQEPSVYTMTTGGPVYGVLFAGLSWVGWFCSFLCVKILILFDSSPLVCLVRSTSIRFPSCIGVQSK